MSSTPRKRPIKGTDSTGSITPPAKIRKNESPPDTPSDPNTSLSSSPPDASTTPVPMGSTVPASVLMEMEGEDTNTSTVQPDDAKPTFVFKDPNFKHSTRGSATNKRARVWKNLKQINAAERALPWTADQVTYGTIGAPPSFIPAKKYSDMSGLPSNYTDPHSKLRYATTEEYSRIPYLPSDIVAGYLALRKASGIVG